MYFLLGLFVFSSYKLNSGYTHAGFTKTSQTRYLLRATIDCENDDQCQYFIRHSKCINNHCECTHDMLLSSDGSKCLEKINEYGSPCEDHVQCSHKLSAGGICEDNECKCKSGYHYLKGICWKSSNLHEKCVRNEQCFSAHEYIGLECNGGVCKCRTNYYERSYSGCRRERRIGESCNLDRDCVDGSTCEKLSCSRTEQEARSFESFSNTTVSVIPIRSNCAKGKFQLNGECVLELGMKCSDDSECSHIPKAFCLDKSVCGCEPATFIASENNRECLRVARGKTVDITSTSCKKDLQCGVFGENSFCPNRRCSCKSESYWEKESVLCWPIKKLGESCDSTLDCHFSETHADCVGNVCNCTAGYHPRKSVCVPDAVEIGASCENDNECLLQYSFCNSSRVCACKKYYYPEKGKCLPGVETQCENQDDCAHLINTECKMGNLGQKQCLCLERHSSSGDRRYCLPVKNLNEECLDSFQCLPQLGDLGECRDKTCQCHKSAHFSHGRCYKSKFIGERCTRLPDCYPGNDTNAVICLKGYCSCNYDYESNENGVCVKTNSDTILRYYSMSLISGIIFNALIR